MSGDPPILEMASTAAVAGGAGRVLLALHGGERRWVILLITVIGAALGDMVTGVSFSLDLQGISVTGWASAADTMSVRLLNGTAAAVDLASGTLRVRVERV